MQGKVFTDDRRRASEAEIAARPEAAQRLVRARYEPRLTQAEVARAVGVSTHAVADIEAGKLAVSERRLNDYLVAIEIVAAANAERDRLIADGIARALDRGAS